MPLCAPTLREYRSEDLESLWQIDQRCFLPGIAYSSRELRYFVQHPRSRTLVAEGKTGIAGFVVGQTAKTGPDSLAGHVITIDVLPELRRHKIGEALLRGIEQHFVQLECVTVLLETAVDNDSALRFYKKHGYTVLKTLPRYYLGQLDGLLLGKSLGPRARSKAKK